MQYKERVEFMAIKTFKRYELKYILDRNQYEAVKAGIAPYVESDAYCVGGKTYGLFNIYYDTDDYAIIRHSISKPPFKEKLRLRSYYENPGNDDKVFIELKKKADGCVNKRRVTMKYGDALEFLETGVCKKTGDYMHDMVAHEIEHFLKSYKVRPKAFIAYDRAAYFLKTDKKIRITFDTNVRGGPAQYGAAGCVPLLRDGLYLMEIKVSDHIPLPIVRVMTANRVFRHGFSKYGTYYTDNIYNSEEIKENARVY